MRQIIAQNDKLAEQVNEAAVARIIAAMTAFMAADSDAEAVIEIDRDLKRAA